MALVAWALLFALGSGCADTAPTDQVSSCPAGPRFAHLLADGRCPVDYLSFAAEPVDTAGGCLLPEEPLGCLIECSAIAPVVACGVRVSDGAVFLLRYVTFLDVLAADGTFRACTPEEQAQWSYHFVPCD